LRDRQGILESQLLSAPATSWPKRREGALRVESVCRGLAVSDTHHRDLVAAVLKDFARLSDEAERQ